MIISTDIKQFIYTFHMPLFFMLSGYLFKFKNSDLGDLFRYKAKTLLVPFLLFTAIAGGINLNWIFSQNGSTFSLEFFLDLFYLRGKVSPNVFLWFCIVMFIAEILFYLFMKIINSVWGYGSIGIVIFACGLIGYELSGKTLPFGIGIAFTAIVFFGFGYAINKINFRKWKTLYLCLTCLLLFVLTFMLGMICNNIVIDMASARYGKYPLFLIAGVAGSLAILLFSVILERFANKHLSILKFWGKNSIVILVTQYFFFLILIAVDHLVLKIGTGYVNNICAVRHRYNYYYGWGDVNYLHN